MNNSTSSSNVLHDNHQLLMLEDYFSILNRRKTSLFATFFLVLIAGLLLAFLLPSIYRSEATILIERQEIPKDLVETTVTGFVQERIEGISKRLLTRENLWLIAEKHNLYEDYRNLDDRNEIFKSMLESIGVEMVDVKTSEPDQFRQGLATIAFTVSFEDESAEASRDVANELSLLYTQENERLRSIHAEEVSEFLVAEGERLNTQLTELERKLAEFKQAEQSQLPELMNLNLQLYEKTDNEIERTNEQIRELEDQIFALQAELAITKSHQDIVDESGNRIMSADERLSVLTAEYLRLSVRYSAQHPDLIRLSREIESLGGEKDVSSVTALIKKLADLKSKLTEARQSYSDDHPDVLGLQKSISAVERGLQTSTVSSSKSTRSASAPDNPRYVSLKTQLNAATGNLKSEKTKLFQLNEKLAEYETRLFKTPVVERDFRILNRDYETARKKYNEIKNKQSEARLAMDLESSSKAERFTIVQPAYLPTLPERPNRIGIVLLSFFLASAAGIGVAAIREYLDYTIYSAKDLSSISSAPPLVSIPYIPQPN